MKHRHNFVRAGECSKPTTTNRSIEGSTYVCIDMECGEMRQVFTDGTLYRRIQGLEEDKDVDHGY